MPLVAPLGAAPSVPPLRRDAGARADGALGLAPMPPGDSSYSFMFPMMMMMGGRRRRSNSFGSNPSDELHPDVPGQPHVARRRPRRLRVGVVVSGEAGRGAA